MRRRLDSALGRIDDLSPERQRSFGLVIFIFAAIVAGILAAHWTRGRIFALDEWKYVVPRQDWTAENFLMPDNGHLIAFPLSIFKGLVEIFGAGSHVPLTLSTIFLQVLVAALLYLNARRRIGPLLALIPAVLILFLGAGWETMLTTAGNVNQFGLAAGLAMLLALEREDRTGDLAAGGLLCISLASFTSGIAFALGALVLLSARRPGMRRIWVALAPLALYAVWLVWSQKYDQTSIVAYSVGSIGNAVFDQLNAICASLTGLFRPGGVPDVSTAISLIATNRSTPLVFILIAWVGWRLLAGPKPAARIWAVLAVLSVYLLLVAIGINPARSVDSSRYAYTGSVLLLLVLVEMTDGLRLGRAWALAATAVAVVALVPNVAQMRTAGSFFQSESEYNRANLAALEFASEQVDPALVPDEGVDTFLPHADLNFEAGQYFMAIERFGSPAFTEGELLLASDAARGSADRLSARAVGLSLFELEGEAVAESVAPEGVVATGGRVLTDSGCLRFVPGPIGDPRLEVQAPPGGALEIRARPGDSVEITLRRFAETFSVALPPLHGPSVVSFPSDASAVPWKASIAALRPLRVCALPSPPA